MGTIIYYIQENFNLIIELTVQHLNLSLASVIVAILIGVPGGILSTRYKSVSSILLNVIDVLYTIPSLALFGLMIPVLGMGTLPAFVALVLYTLLPIVQNTYTGIKNIDSSIIESAVGMGMGPFRLLFAIELPLSFSVILAGIRTALVNSIGLTTIAAYIGAGGLGVFVFRGISSVSPLLISIGSIPVVLMSLTGDYLLKIAEEKYSFKG
ncbi:MAG: ABC transporter permease [Dethiobacteria bacterium]